MNRRDFVKTTLSLVASGLILPSFSRRALARRHPAATLLRAAGDDEVLDGRILVIVNLSGGNDGLNMVVPVGDPLYYAARPTLAVPPDQAVMIGAETGLHPALAPLGPFHDAGRLGVTYPDPNLSHFRSTDIWFSASAADDVISTGWLARFIEAAFPDFPDVLPLAPYGLQQAFGHDVPLAGDRGSIGVVVDNPDTFYDLVGQTYAGEWSDELPDTRGGEELAFVRGVDLESFQYAQAIQAAADLGTNTVAYPTTNLGTQLEIVARLISGDLDTPMFLTAEFGFDTHVSQATVHGNLMASLGQSLAAFMTDLDNQGLADRVLVLTTSEFGRRVNENGGLGTDHGTAAPILALGAGVSGGMFGTNPSLSELDPNGNLLLQHDFRSIFTTVLRDHFGATEPSGRGHPPVHRRGDGSTGPSPTRRRARTGDVSSSASTSTRPAASRRRYTTSRDGRSPRWADGSTRVGTGSCGSSAARRPASTSCVCGRGTGAPRGRCASFPSGSPATVPASGPEHGRTRAHVPPPAARRNTRRPGRSRYHPPRSHSEPSPHEGATRVTTVDPPCRSLHRPLHRRHGPLPGRGGRGAADPQPCRPSPLHREPRTRCRRCVGGSRDPRRVRRHPL